MLPAPSFSPTPPHQDFTHVQGAKTFWTLWFPVGDVPLELGGLSVLSESNHDGIYRYTANSGAGGLESMICETEHAWHTAPMRAGDALTFHSHTVHKSNPNRVPDLVRLSCDLRYQPASMAVEERSLKVHCDVASWDEIYEGWTNDRLKYYWRRNDLVFSEWDPSLVQTHRNIC
jgi:ectoine hydroxylase-related dioxygenase (phytanoyl-CoA dioxygenase family)